MWAYAACGVDNGQATPEPLPADTSLFTSRRAGRHSATRRTQASWYGPPVRRRRVTGHRATQAWATSRHRKRTFRRHLPRELATAFARSTGTCACADEGAKKKTHTTSHTYTVRTPHLCGPGTPHIPRRVYPQHGYACAPWLPGSGQRYNSSH